MKRYFKDYAVLLSIAGTIVILDQLTKHIVRTNLPYGQVYRPELWLSQYVRIVHWRNTGAAFGLFQNMSIVFTILGFIVAGVILFYYPRIPREEWLIRLAMSLQMGGALGNLVDRLFQDGQVTDFVSVGNFPVFNVADASISVGTAILFFALWDQERKGKQLLDSSAQTEEDQPDQPAMTSLQVPEDAQGE